MWNHPRLRIGAGRQHFSAFYIEKTREIIGEQVAIFPRILPKNRPKAERYLNYVTTSIAKLSAGLESPELPEGIPSKFKEPIERELAVIQENLESIKYCIDNQALVPFVVGCKTGKIENVSLSILLMLAISECTFQSVCLLIYLLVKSNLEIFRNAQSRILDDKVFVDLTTTIQQVFSAITIRANELQKGT